MKEIERILNFVERYDKKLFMHLDNTAMYTYGLARELRLEGTEREHAYLLGLLHDVGRVFSEDLVGTKELWAQLQGSAHLFTYAALTFVEPLSQVALLLLQQQERWDGTGTPYGLQGEEIPLLIRILAVGDCYANITARELQPEQAHTLLFEEAGKRLDPALLVPFVQMLQREKL